MRTGPTTWTPCLGSGEPENESEKEKQDLKSQVEAIMARREAMVGSKE